MPDSSISWPLLLETLLEGKDLSESEARSVIDAWLAEDLSPVQTGAFLAAFRAKGVSGLELSSMAKVLREACLLPLPIPSLEMVDTCGTGGDGADTFNISTAVAFLSAACGAKVAKHGNRSASGKVGSADVLEGLGIPLDAPLDKALSAVSEKNITFLFAPKWHSSLVNLAPLRKSLGIRTIFNLLGPLVNPLKPRYQVLGVAKPDLLDPMSEALFGMGLDKAVVVHGYGGLDEASLEGPNEIRLLEGGKLTSLVLDPSDLGIASVSNSEIQGGDLNRNIDILSSVLKGQGTNPQKQVVALNNTLVLWATGIETDFKCGFNKSLECLESGLAWNVFLNLKNFLE
tara:strand:- start:283 stop:1314 length:1032 start_codon:yes stop_codon:yes gene_type:complete